MFDPRYGALGKSSRSEIEASVGRGLQSTASYVAVAFGPVQGRAEVAEKAVEKRKKMEEDGIMNKREFMVDRRDRATSDGCKVGEANKPDDDLLLALLSSHG